MSKKGQKVCLETLPGGGAILRGGETDSTSERKKTKINDSRLLHIAAATWGRVHREFGRCCPKPIAEKKGAFKHS